MNDISVEIKGGRIIGNIAADENYPGVDIEFVPDGYEGEYINPRILFEFDKESETLRALIWADKNYEDYTHEIVFDMPHNKEK